MKKKKNKKNITDYLKNLLFTPLYISSYDPRKISKRIEILETNQFVLQNYIITLARLQFIIPKILQREIKNSLANTEYTTALYDTSKQTEDKKTS